MYCCLMQVDEFVVPKNAALQLAGLQAQIQYGDFNEDKLSRLMWIKATITWQTLNKWSKQPRKILTDTQITQRTLVLTATVPW